MGLFSSRRLVGAVAIVAALAAPLDAQRRGGRGGDQAPPQWQGKGEVSGKVVDEAGKGVANAKVTLVHVPVNSGLFVMTKKSGEFTAKSLKAGEWRVQVEAPNFPIWRQTVQVADKNNPVVDVQLKQDNSPELIAAAEELFKAGKFAEARVEYMKVLAAHPELTAINRAIAFTYGRERNHAEALKYLDLALVNNPNDAVLLQLAAASATEVADFPRAVGYLGKIDMSALTDPEPLTNGAVNLLNKRRSAEAITVLDRVLARFPEAPDAYFYRGFAKLQADKTAEGKADLEKFVALAPAGAPQLAQAKELLAKIR